MDVRDRQQQQRRQDHPQDGQRRSRTPPSNAGSDAPLASRRRARRAPRARSPGPPVDGAARHRPDEATERREPGLGDEPDLAVARSGSPERESPAPRAARSAIRLVSSAAHAAACGGRNAQGQYLAADREHREPVRVDRERTASDPRGAAASGEMPARAARERAGVGTERGREHVAARFLAWYWSANPLTVKSSAASSPVRSSKSRRPASHTAGTAAPNAEHRRSSQRGDGARDAIRRPLDERVQDLVALAPGNQRDQTGKVTIDGRPGERLVLPETAPLQVREPERKGQAGARGDDEPRCAGRPTRGVAAVGVTVGSSHYASDPVRHRATGTRRPSLSPSCSTRADRPPRGRRAIVRFFACDR